MKSIERLTQTNGKKLLINYKLPNVHVFNDGICFETVFGLIKSLSSKIILRNSFVDLLYSLVMTNEEIKINVLVFGLTSPLIQKEIRFLNKVPILKDINKERIYRGHLTEKSLDDHLTDDDIKKFKQDIEIEVSSLIAFLHKHQHIVQTPYEKEFSRKHTKDRTMLTSSFSQYDWTKRTDSLTDVPNKIIIDDILAPFVVISNIHITDVLIKESLPDSLLLIIKENINCGNFLNKDRFSFLTDKANHKSLTDFPKSQIDFSQTITIVDKRLYGEALFHVFSQNEIYSNTCKMDRIMIDFVKFLNSNPSNIEILHHDCSYTITQRGHKGV